MIATVACIVALAVPAPAPATTAETPTTTEPAAETAPPPVDPATIADPVLRAEAYFQQQRYAEAAQSFAEAYEQDPKVSFLYARAQAERLSGRCDVAVQYYDRFLASGPPAEAAKDAKDNRARCTATDPPPVPPPKVTPSADEPVDGDRPRRKWPRDPAGGVLVALGSVTAVIGASLIAFASTRDGTATGAPNEGEYLTRKKAARIQHRVGIAATAVGGAMLVAGITRWAVLASRERKSGRADREDKQRVRAGVAGDRRGASITVAVWF